MKRIALIGLLLLANACSGASSNPNDAGSSDAGAFDAGNDGGIDAGASDAGPNVPFITCYGVLDTTYDDGGLLPDGGYLTTQFTTEVAYLPRQVQTGTYCVYQRAATDTLDLYSHHECFDVVNQLQGADTLVNQKFQVEVEAGAEGFETHAYQTYEIALPAGVDPSAIDDGGLGGGQVVDLEDSQLSADPNTETGAWACKLGYQQ